MMRWASRFPDGESSAVGLHSSGTDPTPLRGYWEALITDIRFADALSGNPADAHLPLARANLKAAARWSRLLNDIPPPTITWNPTTRVATVKRGTKPDGSDIGFGRVLILGGENAPRDPVDQGGSPAYNPPYAASVPFTPNAADKYVTARVYGPDIDGDSGWSAIEILEIP